MWVWSLGQEDLLEEEMAIHFSTIAWKIPWTEKPGRLQSTGSQRVGHHWATSHAHMQRYEVISPPENHHPTNPGNLIISLTPLTPLRPLTSLLPFFKQPQVSKAFFLLFWQNWVKVTLQSLSPSALTLSKICLTAYNSWPPLFFFDSPSWAVSSIQARLCLSCTIGYQKSQGTQ